ncbi:MAG: hypothetical protein WD294_02315 [Phycisphaeraceae bacterium]
MNQKADAWTGIEQPLVMVSSISNWQTVAEDLSQADNAGDPVVRPDTLSEQRRLEIAGRGTLVLLRVRYQAASPPSTPPTVAIFGVDQNGHHSPLFTADGDHAIAVPVSASRDVQDGDGYAYTAPIAADADGAAYVIAAVEIALAAGSGADDSALQLKVI